MEKGGIEGHVQQREGKDGPSIFDFIKFKAGGAPNLIIARENWLGNCVPGHMVSRTVYKNFELEFKGSLRQWQNSTEQGIPVSTFLSDIITETKRFYPMMRRVNRDKMSPLEVELIENIPSDKYDLSSAIVHSVTIKAIHNTFNVPVGFYCNATPKVYMDMGNEEIKRLLKYFSDGSGESWCNKHIPANMKSEHTVPVIKEVSNGFNSGHIVKTFGGIHLEQASHIMNGLRVVPPNVCQKLNLAPPKRKWVVPDNVDVNRMPPQKRKMLKQNTWVIVPSGHAHTWVCSLSKEQILSLGYEIYPIRVNEEIIPFYLMDFLTIDKLNFYVGKNIIPHIDRRDIRGISFTLQPFLPAAAAASKTNVATHGGGGGGAKWTDYDPMIQNHDEVGILKLKMIISYTLFPLGMSNNKRICCMLSEGFPPLIMASSIPLVKGQEGDEVERQGPAKRQERSFY